MLTGKSVVFLFLHGGPSQFETFDPKMSMPEGVRSTMGELATRLPGVTSANRSQGLSPLADRLTAVRSHVPGDANHNLKPLVDRDTFEANLGSIYSRVADTNDPQTGPPVNIVFFPSAVDASTRLVSMNIGKFTATDPPSSTDAPFDPSQGGPELRMPIPRDRLDDRLALLTALDGLARQLDQSRALEGSNLLLANRHDLARLLPARPPDVDRGNLPGGPDHAGSGQCGPPRTSRQVLVDRQH